MRKVAHHNVVKLIPWRGRTSKKEFRKRFIALMREHAPHLHYVESREDELDVCVEGVADVVAATISLRRGYKEFIESPKERDQILARWVKAQRWVVNPQAVSPANVIPMIKDRGWLHYCRSQYGNEPPEPGSGRDMLFEAINEEFLAAYTERAGGIRYLHISDLEEMGLTREALREQALANLRAMSAGREIRLAGGIWLIGAPDAPMASQMLDDDVWNDPKLAHLDPLIVAAPGRDVLIAADGESPGEIWHVSHAAAFFARDDPYPNSPRLMIRRNAGFDLLDPHALDESHPIPNLDVIDFIQKASKDGRELTVAGIVIASPLDAGPRSVHRLFRKFEACLAHLDCDGSPAKLAVPEDEKPRINVSVHPKSHSDVLELLNSIDGYVFERGALLKINVTE